MVWYVIDDLWLVKHRHKRGKTWSSHIRTPPKDAPKADKRKQKSYKIGPQQFDLLDGESIGFGPNTWLHQSKHTVGPDGLYNFQTVRAWFRSPKYFEEYKGQERTFAVVARAVKDDLPGYATHGIRHHIDVVEVVVSGDLQKDEEADAYFIDLNVQPAATAP